MLALSKQTIASGDSRGYFNVSSAPYNASSAQTAAFNTAAFNTAIADALPSSGTVYIGPGTYLLNTLAWNPRVSLMGAGVNTTTLKSVAAEPMIVYAGMEMIYDPQGPQISHIRFDGANVGTTCWQIRAFAYYNFHHLYFTGFNRAVDSQGVILGEWSHVHFINCANGWRSLFTSNTSLGVMQSNLNIMTQCQFQGITGHGIELEQAASLQLRYCDFENTGTTGIDQSGAILLHEMAPNSEGVCLLVDGCWFEVNRGTLIDLRAPLGNTRTIIQNTLMHQYSGSASAGLRVDGSTSFLNKVFLSGSTILGFPKDVSSSGSSAIVEVISSTIGVHEQLQGATYAEFTTGANSGSSATPALGGMSASAVAYLPAGFAAAPFYFNDMAEAATFATPRIGTAPMVLRAVGSLSDYNGGAFTNRRTAKFNGGASGADVSLNLSTYAEVGFEMIYYVNAPVGNYNNLLGLGTNWTSVPGAFRVAPHAPSASGGAFYVGANGNIGINEKRRAEGVGPGWKHIYMQITSRTGLSRLTVNNVIATILTDSTTANNTNNFLNGALAVMCEPGSSTVGEDGRMSHFAVYTTAFPTDARIAAHYNAIFM